MSDKTEHPPLPEKFAALGVRNSILRALAVLEYHTPSEIQAMLIPRALAGVDILGQARTGTGKTASFGIPLLAKVTRGAGTQALAMVPTRELAAQVESEIQRLGQFTQLRVVSVVGGQKVAAQAVFLKHEPEIVVGTPGRVMDLFDRRMLSFAHLRFVVLDEVDRMLDIGFRDDIKQILTCVKQARARAAAGPKRVNAHASPDEVLPPDDGKHQTIFVSATISSEIEKLARTFMTEPVEKLVVPGADDAPTVSNVEQYYLPVQQWDKYKLLKKLIEQEQPELGIIFCRTKHGAEKLAKRLTGDGFECREIHGNLNQARRDKVMKNFRTGKFDLLIATDLASRGIDVQDITHIVNYDIPEDPEVYVHRIGRTARMGAKGKAFTFVMREQGDELTKVENLINMVVPKGDVAGFEPSPPPADWKEFGPGQGPLDGPSKPIQNRYERAYGQLRTPTVEAEPNADGTPAAVPAAPKPAPPRTIGSKIPVNRRRGRR